MSELEELDPDAILAHEAMAHAPQKRAHVHEEERSIVISDPDPEPVSSQPAAHAYGSGRGDATLVIRDRTELEAARRRILSQRRRRGFSRNAVWFGFAFAAFAIGGAVALFSMRTRGPVAVHAGTVSASFPPSSHSAAPTEPAPAANEPEKPRQVQLEELPVEQPAR